MTHFLRVPAAAVVVFQGGLMGGQITEIVGTSGKGKTQVRHCSWHGMQRAILLASVSSC